MVTGRINKSCFKDFELSVCNVSKLHLYKMYKKNTSMNAEMTIEQLRNELKKVDSQIAILNQMLDREIKIERKVKKTVFKSKKKPMKIFIRGNMVTIPAGKRMYGDKKLYRNLLKLKKSSYTEYLSDSDSDSTSEYSSSLNNFSAEQFSVSLSSKENSDVDRSSAKRFPTQRSSTSSTYKEDSEEKSGEEGPSAKTSPQANSPAKQPSATVATEDPDPTDSSSSAETTDSTDRSSEISLAKQESANHSPDEDTEAESSAVEDSSESNNSADHSSAGLLCKSGSSLMQSADGFDDIQTPTESSSSDSDSGVSEARCSTTTYVLPRLGHPFIIQCTDKYTAKSSIADRSFKNQTDANLSPSYSSNELSETTVSYDSGPENSSLQNFSTDRFLKKYLSPRSRMTINRRLAKRSAADPLLSTDLDSDSDTPQRASPSNIAAANYVPSSRSPTRCSCGKFYFGRFSSHCSLTKGSSSKSSSKEHIMKSARFSTRSSRSKFSRTLSIKRSYKCPLSRRNLKKKKSTMSGSSTNYSPEKQSEKKHDSSTSYTSCSSSNASPRQSSTEKDTDDILSNFSKILSFPKTN